MNHRAQSQATVLVLDCSEILTRIDLKMEVDLFSAKKKKNILRSLYLLSSTSRHVRDDVAIYTCYMHSVFSK